MAVRSSIPSLSAQQERAAAAICRFVRDHGRMPSVRALATTLGLSPTTTFQHVSALRRKAVLVTVGGSMVLSRQSLRRVLRALPVEDAAAPAPAARRAGPPAANGGPATQPPSADSLAKFDRVWDRMFGR